MNSVSSAARNAGNRNRIKVLVIFMGLPPIAVHASWLFNPLF
jgi:hypothetical protein